MTFSRSKNLPALAGSDLIEVALGFSLFKGLLFGELIPDI